MELLKEQLTEKLSELHLSKKIGEGNPEETKDILFEIYGELQKMREAIDTKKNEIIVMRNQVQAANRYSALTKEFMNRINYLTLNIPTNASNIGLPSKPSKQTNSTQVAVTGVGTAANANKSQKKAEKFSRVQYLTIDEFESTPKFMKGRIKYEMACTAVDELNSALETKYNFLAKPFSSYTGLSDKNRYRMLKSQENESTKGNKFVTADDLKTSNLLKTETNRRNFLTILRHFKKVREIRGPGNIVRFVPM